MSLLVVAATVPEIDPLLQSFRFVSEGAVPRVRRYSAGGRDVDVLVTGIGMVATAAWCARALAARRYEHALNLGVCGSFDPALAPGEVVHVVTDRIAELGAEDRDRFLTLPELGLPGDDEPPFRGGLLVNDAPAAGPALAALPAVTGITVNTAHGSAETIARVRERFGPQVESMEGAAFMYACLISGVRFAQVRAISNVVEPRNRAAWKMAEAVAALDEAARPILEQL